MKVKAFLFFVCMMLCAIESSNAEVLAGLKCTEGDVVHIFQGESDNREIIYIDGKVYNYVKDHTVGDISFTQFAKEDDENELAFLHVHLNDYSDENESPEIIKLVLLRHGEKTAKFGGLCKFVD